MVGVGGKRYPVALGLMLALGLSSPVYTAEPPALSKSTADSVDLARGLIDAEQFAKALDVLKHIEIKDDDTVAQVDLLLGRLYLSVGKPQKAEDYFSHASLSSLKLEADLSLGLAESEVATAIWRKPARMPRTR